MPHRHQRLELKIPPLALTAAMALVMWLLAGWWPSHVELPDWAVGLAAILVLVGLGLCLSAVWLFRSKHTTVNPTTPEAVGQMVCTGVYRFTRNPMYLAFLCALGAWALVLASPWAAMALPVFVLYLNRFQIEPEERALRAKFGASYEDYAQQVRRWL